MDKVSYVDPIIGTVGDEKATSLHGGGKVHPGACTPGGMVQLSPDTVTGGDNGTGYNYCQNTIEGFSFNHMSGIGWYGDLGNLQLMPTVGETDLRSGSNAEVPFEKGTLGWKSPFSHENETAQAGYYRVLLDRYQITAEATVAPHAGMLRFSYPAGSDARVIFNFSRRIAGHADFQSIEVVGNDQIQGSIVCTPAGGGFGRGQGGIGYTLYFCCRLSRPATELRFFEKETYLTPGIAACSGEDVGLVAHLGTKLDEPLVIKCGISYTDLAGAIHNLNAEIPDFDFDRVHREACGLWEKAFACVEVEGTDTTDLTLFYTCLYHTLLDPRTTMDADGRFKMADGTIRQADDTHRTMFSGWDVYRSEFPMLTLLRPDIVNDEVNSLLRIALHNNTSLPKWELMGIDSKCMVGDPGLIVTADAYTKGIRGFDIQKAYEICLASSLCKKELFGKPFRSLRPEQYEYTQQYLQDAYVPEALSLTLELLMADYAMYRFAKAMGKEADAQYFLNRVKRYPENYNEALGFMCPRDKQGEFIPVADEYAFDGCVESNIFQQSWFVPYDVEGLSALFGEARTVTLLERLFADADLTALWNENYNHSNEPCHNLTHYFNCLGLAHRTQYWTRQVQKKAYRLGPFGFYGNEDVGQLSAWYVLSALGFAQIAMGDEKYYINTPLFKSAKIRLDPQYHNCSIADHLEIRCDQDPLEYPYIQALYLNGAPLSRCFVTYRELTAGGKLEFILSKTPCLAFGKVSSQALA